MLLSFGAKNFCGFKDWLEVDLTLNSKVPQEVSGGKGWAQTLCLKGANASGKTNALKILSFLNAFCVNSFSRKPESEIDIDSYFGNPDPIDFFCHFNVDSTEYFYELSLTRSSVLSEKIFRKEKRKSLIYHRNTEAIVKNLVYKSPDLPTRKNASIISTLKQFEIKEFDVFYNFFHSICSNVNHFLGLETEVITHSKASAFYNSHAEYLDFTKQYLKKFDTGIVNIEISSYEKSDAKKEFFPLFTHDASVPRPVLTWFDQSSGTKSLYNFLLLYYGVLKFGGILVMDEFDVNLHPDILPHLVNMFEDEKTNLRGAQLIFSTHNSDIIDFVGKYKTYLFNKKNGECFAYRLDEIEASVIRNDRPISPLYKTGKIGGVPKI
jgi:AAA15 family ATPase/GTPase